ncbi:MAG: GGDEF domain-containing protein [Planctomycetota bacterium]
MTSTLPEIPPALIQADKLPSLPLVATEILRCMQDDDATLEDLTRVIGRDPALEKKLLELANSAMFSTGGSPITTLQRAVAQLGLKTVELMSLSFALAGALPTQDAGGGLDVAQYWQRSVIGAVAARTLLARLGSHETDEAFLAGLMGHIGKLVTAQCLPDDYAPVARAAGGWPSLAQEAAALGFHSSDVSAALLASWSLPPRLVEPVAYMLQAEAMPLGVLPESRRLVPLMQLAQLAATTHCEEERGPAFAAFQAGVEERLGWTSEDIDVYFAELDLGIGELAPLFSLSLEDRLSPAEILADARLQMTRIRLRTAAEPTKTALGKEGLREQTETDPLTKLANRSALDEFLGRHLAARRNGTAARALGIVKLDIDRFQHFNEAHGREAGDDVLRMVGYVLAHETRKLDLAARYGGEEFVVVCPETNPFGLKALGERLRKAIEGQTVMVDGRERRVTASFGAACTTRIGAASDGEQLLELADHYLAKAKENGRNRCEVYPKMQLPDAA